MESLWDWKWSTERHEIKMCKFNIEKDNDHSCNCSTHGHNETGPLVFELIFQFAYFLDVEQMVSILAVGNALPTYEWKSQFGKSLKLASCHKENIMVHMEPMVFAAPDMSTNALLISVTKKSRIELSRWDFAVDVSSNCLRHVRHNVLCNSTTVVRWVVIYR